MQFKSSILLTSVLLTAPVLAHDDGLWHPNGSSSGPAIGAGAGAQQQSQWSSPNTTPVPQAPAAGNNNPEAWKTQVTWPAGCDKWANPCPAGAIISGGAAAATNNPIATTTAPYSNDFTSYTTQTDSRGVVTGMPSVVTVPAGVNDTSSTTLSTTVRANTTSTRSRGSSIESGFSQSTSRPAVFGNTASAQTISWSVALSACAVVIALL